MSAPPVGARVFNVLCNQKHTESPSAFISLARSLKEVKDAAGKSAIVKIFSAELGTCKEIVAAGMKQDVLFAVTRTSDIFDVYNMIILKGEIGEYIEYIQNFISKNPPNSAKIVLAFYVYDINGSRDDLRHSLVLMKRDDKWISKPTKTSVDGFMFKKEDYDLAMTAGILRFVQPFYMLKYADSINIDTITYDDSWYHSDEAIESEEIFMLRYSFRGTIDGITKNNKIYVLVNKETWLENPEKMNKDYFENKICIELANALNNRQSLLFDCKNRQMHKCCSVSHMFLPVTLFLMLYNVQDADAWTDMYYDEYKYGDISIAFPLYKDE